MKKFVFLFVASIASFSCLQGKALGNSSLLMQMPSLLAGAKSGTTMINDNVTVIDESNSAKIIGTNTGALGETELKLSGDLANSVQSGSVLYIPAGVDSRFPFGIAGKVVSVSSNADGIKTVVLGEASYADVVKEASFNLDNITLDASNFVGVIAPTAVEAAAPMQMAAATASAADGSIYSFRNGAVVVRKAAGKDGMMYSAAEGGTIDAGTVSLNMKVDLAKMGVDASRMSPIDAQTSVGFVITGSLNNIKLTNEHDFSLFGGGLKSLDLRVDGDFNFDVKFNGKGSVKFGYFSQAWNEVKDESFKAFGASAKLTGLSADDKIGKFPLAGLVFSVPCPPQKPCIVKPGTTQTPLRQAKALGIIVWLYLTAEGEFSLDGNLTLAHLNQGGLSVGIKKPSGSNFQLISALTKRNSSQCLIEALKLDGKAGFQLQAGITADIDFFASGVRIANAGADIGGLFKAEATWKDGYLCVNDLGSSMSWETGEGRCISGGLGAGLIARASANVGIEIDTSWKDMSGDLEYKFQIPTDDEKDDPGRHGLWYYKTLFDTCVPTVTSKTGRIWMDRNLSASRVATSMSDEQAFGDLYQWGRLADGHEKRTSGTTSTLSSNDVPGHDKFISVSSDHSDWRSPRNDNLWQGVNGVNNPCPAGFRVPTSAEWQEEIDSWSSQNPTGAFASPLRLIMAGSRIASNGSVDGEGLRGGYWSSTILNNDFNGSPTLLVLGGALGTGTYRTSRAAGYSIRCIKDKVAQVPTVVSAATGRIWMDRDIGASRVATSMTDTEAYGDLYQWGRGKDGHEKRTSGITATLSSTDTPGHGNFITTTENIEPHDWREPQNENLWQGVGGVNNPCPAGFRVPTADEWQKEIDSWSSNDAAGAFASPLKLPLGGYRIEVRYFPPAYEGSTSFYWSSTTDGGSWSYGASLVLNHYPFSMDRWARAKGGSVRCIKD